jgi:predicted DNA-binding protein (MmcQ/YjbR family)
MTVESIRRFCLSFPHASEKLQWGGILCFKVGTKIFALLNLEAVPPRLMFKCDPEKFAELVEQEDIIPAPHFGRYHWVSFERLDVLPWSDAKDLIEQSYQMVAANAKIVRARTKVRKPKARKPKARRAGK